MTSTLLLSLAGLALIDSTSIGTLVLPIWLLLSPSRPRPIRLLIYLGAIAVFYLLIGIGLTTLLASGADHLTDSLRTRPVLIGQLCLGIALFVFSFRFDSKRRREQGKPDRATAWRERALRSQGSPAGLAALAVTAGLIEVFSMLPYLGAMALIVSADLTAAQWPPLLVGYCLVMVLPALVLIGARSALHDRIEPALVRIDGFFSRHADSTTGWVVGIVGFLIVRDAAAHLFAA